ncbi:cation:dicarboxylate symporter family transporter [Streptomyces sp. MAI_2237]
MGNARAVGRVSLKALIYFEVLTMLGVMLLPSKGAACVTGSGFIALAATLSAVPHVPVAALALIFGIDRLMSEDRALTSRVGNGVATLAVARWEGELDEDRQGRPVRRDPLHPGPHSFRGADPARSDTGARTGSHPRPRAAH